MLEGYRSSSCAQVATRSPCPSVVRPLSVLGIPPVTMLGCFYRRRSELEPSQNILSLSVLVISPVQPSALPCFPNNESPLTNNDFSPYAVVRHPSSVLCPSSVFLL